MKFSVLENTILVGETLVDVYVTDEGTRLVDAFDIQPLFLPFHIIEKMSKKTELKSILTEDLKAALQMIEYATNGTTYIAATTILDIADLLLDARNILKLDQEELAMARQAEKLVIEFAKIGINALVDEATGHIGK